MELVSHVIVYLVSFIGAWIGAGLIVASVEKFARRLRLSSFAVAFFVLGLLTSLPEFAVGMTSLSQNDPEIFVGNLLGGIPVIFLLIIPILAIFGNGINLNHKLDKKSMLFTLAVILTPAFLLIDKKMTVVEGIIMIVLYLLLFYVIERKKGIMDYQHSKVMHLKFYSLTNIFKIILGIVILFIASNFIVDNTLFLSESLNVSPFYLSLIALSIGTNAPELSLAIRSIVSGKKDIAFGDYMGSAAANTFLFGLFTVINGGEFITQNGFWETFLMIAFGLSVFYIFSRSNNRITRGEGLVLLLIYILFATVEAI